MRCLIFILFFLTILNPIEAKENELKVMVINFFEKGNFWPDGITEGFVRELRSSNVSFSEQVLYYPEYNDKEKILLKVDEYKPDLILLTDDAIADLLMPDLMSRKIVTFFTGVNRLSKDLDWFKPKWRSLQSGVIQHYRASESINLLKRLKPINKVGILSGPSKAGISLANFIKDDIKSAFPQVKVTVHSKANFKDWKNSLKELNDSNDALWPLLPFHVRHECGELISWKQAGDYMRSVITLPTVGVGNLDGDIDRLFAIGINPKEMGKQVAIQAFFFIKGENMINIPVERFRFHNFQIKYSEVKRLKLDLPEDLYGFAQIVEHKK